MTIWTVVAATGHRPQHLPPSAREWVRPELDRIAVKLKREHGTCVGISGMAIGVDQWWARSVLRAGLQLWAYVPFPQQPDKWRDEDRAEWADLLKRAAKVREFGKSYSVKLLHARNDGMLDEVDTAHGALVAVHRSSKTTGGTAGAVAKAERRRLPIIHIDPDTQTVRLRYRPAIGSAA